MTTKIITTNDRPPVPTTQFDWTAYLDGHEEEQVYGYGATEQAAIDNLWVELDGDDKYGELLDSITREMFECGYSDLKDPMEKTLIERRFLQVVR
jgi:hypothetical protein